MAALVALAHPSHILLYAPGDARAYRLATPRTILENNDFRPVCGYFAASPPACNPTPFENRVLFLSQAMAALVALAIPELI
ncbi:hypothetical protein CDU03_18555 [Cronobacter sakazakii]|nr:hypothetical protein CDU03_18555 [Cronobacter sakazakii]